MNRVLLIFILGLLSAISAYSRETVKGTVVDSKGVPVPGVKVEIPGSSEFTFTDLDGAFQITLRDPVKSLNFTYPGFGTISRRVQPEMAVMLGKGWEGNAKGFRGMVDLEGGMGVKGNVTIKSGSNIGKDIHTMIMPGMTFTFGRQFGKHLFIGAGLGAYLDLIQFEQNEQYNYRYYNWLTTKLSGAYIPIYLAARWDFGLTKKTAPYIGLRVGYAQYIADVDKSFCYAYSSTNNLWPHLEIYPELCGSMFFAPSIGYHMTLHNKFGMNIGLRYMTGMKKKYSAESWYEHRYFEQSGNLDYDYEYVDFPSKIFTQKGSDVIMFNIGFDF